MSATSQKPQQVIDAISHYYETTNSNVHRGAHYLSDLATQKFEAARSTVQDYINAKDRKEILWTRGTTESINLVAQTWGESNLQQQDEIIISALEHHSNIVPWQILCQKTGAQLKVIDVKENGELDFEHYKQLLNSKTKLLAIGHISNALGVINPIKQMIELAHNVGAVVFSIFSIVIVKCEFSRIVISGRDMAVIFILYFAKIRFPTIHGLGYDAYRRIV